MKFPFANKFPKHKQNRFRVHNWRPNKWMCARPFLHSWSLAAHKTLVHHNWYRNLSSRAVKLLKNLFHCTISISRGWKCEINNQPQLFDIRWASPLLFSAAVLPIVPHTIPKCKQIVTFSAIDGDTLTGVTPISSTHYWLHRERVQTTLFYVCRPSVIMACISHHNNKTGANDCTLWRW